MAKRGVLTRGNSGSSGMTHHHGCTSHGHSSNKNNLGFEIFSGFKPAVEACFLDWEDYPLPGITYNNGASWLYHTQPFTCFRFGGESARSEHVNINPVSSMYCVLFSTLNKINSVLIKNF